MDLRVLKAWTFNIPALFMLCCVSVPLGGNGLAARYGMFGTKLSKAVPALNDMELLHMATLGHLTGLAFVLLACKSWTSFLTAYFVGAAVMPGNIRQDRQEQFVTFAKYLAIFILGLDAIMFYNGLALEIADWGPPELISVVALLGTVMYCAACVFISFQSFNLRHK